jgi:hypothetical protein
MAMATAASQGFFRPLPEISVRSDLIGAINDIDWLENAVTGSPTVTGTQNLRRAVYSPNKVEL